MARSRKNPSVTLPLLIGGGVVAAGAVWYFFLRETPSLKYPGLLAPPVAKSTFSPSKAAATAAATAALLSMSRDERTALRRAG